jgi:tetratricopeptide (TPR) repeat protein
VQTDTGVVRLVNPDTGREYARLEDPNQSLPGSLRFSSDGAQLVATSKGSQPVHVWDLRVIRERLATMRLDWDLPPYLPAAATAAAPPLRAVVDMGSVGAVGSPVPDEPQAIVVKYSLAIALQPINPEAYLRRGSAYHRLRQWRQAVEDLTLALALGPAGNDPDVWFMRAFAYGALGQQDRAVADYSKLIDMNLYGGMVWNNRGVAYRALGQQDKALTDFTEAVRLQPEDVFAWRQRGDIYAGRGEWDRAILDIATAVKVQPNDHYLWYQLACLHAQVADSAGYCRDCKVLLQRFGQTSDPLVARRVALSCLLRPDAGGDRSQVLQLAEQALAGRPQEAWSLLTLGAAYHRAGQFAQAIQRLEQALVAPTADPYTSILAQLLLAMAHHAAGHADEARQWLDRAIQRSDKALPGEGSKVPWPNWGDWIMCRCLRQEAEALLKEKTTGPGK